MTRMRQGLRSLAKIQGLPLILAVSQLAILFQDVSPVSAQQAINIGTRLELFVDHYLIDQLRNAELRLHSPKRAEIALEFNAPWEGRGSTDTTVFKDGDKYRMYYRGAEYYDEKQPDEFTCYAESPDGIHWSKPVLELFEFRGSKENNIIWAGDEITHNFAPFKDLNPAAPADQRYKAVGGKLSMGGLTALVSADGIHWKKLREEPVITDGAFDSHNLAFWDEERQLYVAYYRDFYPGGIVQRRATPPEKRGESVRAIKIATSTDFIHWTEGQWLDYGGAPLEHFYTNSTTPYFRAPHIYLAFPKRFVPGRKALPEWETWHPYGPSAGTSDGVFMTSRDGLHWDRTFMEAFLRPGLDSYNWSNRNMRIAWGVVPTGPEEISIYWAEHFKHASNRMVRGTLRPDGFISVNGPYAGGELLTKPLVFGGTSLHINFSTSAPGSIRIELQNSKGEVIDGYALEDCEEIFGDQLDRVVRWGENHDLSSLAGQAVRLRVVLRDADLYSIEFRP